jgi:hypothetical protein
MTCKMTLSLLTETQEGNVGSDWKYKLDAKVFNQGLKGEGVLKVAKHTLDAGEVQEPHGAPEPLTLDCGEGGREVMIRLALTATEVDLFISDSGTATTDLKLMAPGPGEAPLSQEFEIAAGVRESPGILNKNAVFTVHGLIVLACD